MKKIIINIDGGSRGNPGPAAYGVVFSSEGDGGVKICSQYLGVMTNNEAEYSALIFALKKAKALFGKEQIKDAIIEVRSDSELLVRQMRGEYKVLEPKIQQLFLRAWNLKIDFKNLVFVSIPRELNKAADKLVNEVLDAQHREARLF